MRTCTPLIIGLLVAFPAWMAAAQNATDSPRVPQPESLPEPKPEPPAQEPLPAPAPEPAPPMVDFDRLEELLERFSRSTMEAVEEEMDRRLDRYEDELDDRQRPPIGDKQTEKPPAAVPVGQYQLVFEIPGVSDEITIHSAGGTYEVRTNRKRRTATPEGAAEELEYRLEVAGTIQSEGESDSVVVGFEGICEVVRTTWVDGAEEQDFSDLSFQGSVQMKAGESRDLVREGDNAVVMSIRPAAAAKQQV